MYEIVQDVSYTSKLNVWKFNYAGSILLDDGKCDIDIWRYIAIAKDNFQKLGKILKD